MLIDFHTHIFPEKIASVAVEVLKANIVKQRGYGWNTYANATIDGLKESMKNNNVDISVVMPIATNPKQTPSINRFAKSVTCDNVISFGSLHPEEDDWEEVLENLAAEGFVGIKLHPEYQGFFVDSERSIAIIKKAEELGLYVTLHAGQDIGMPLPVHCSPERLKNVLEYVNGDKIIAAHLGGFWEWYNVEKYLVGTNIYLDTAVISHFIDAQQCRRIILNHGSDKVLFATDSPWESPTDEYNFMKSLDLTENDYDNIFYKNALKILDMEETK